MANTSQLEVGSGSDAFYRPFNDDDNNKAGKGSSMSWYASLTAAVMGSGASASDRLDQKMRKVPVKIEPKVFFANERTFLSWMNMSVTLATISLAVVAFGDSSRVSKVYGLVLLPIAIGFVGYSLYSFIRRAGMIRRKDPGPYDDWFGPIGLAILLAITIIALFVINLHTVITRT